MREIKFRGWKPSKNIMEYDVYKESPNLMQHTGILDENGKGIYEGDILDTRSDTVEVVCWDEQQAKFKSVPLYLYHLNAGSGGWTGYNLYNRYLRIVGNIHQHPELLNN